MNSIQYKNIILNLSYLDNNLFKYYKKVVKCLFEYGYSINTKCNIIDNTRSLFVNELYSSEQLEYIFKTRNCIAVKRLTNSISFLDSIDFYTLFRKKYLHILNYLRKLSNSNIRKSTRLKHKIERMIEKPCLFLTMTFSDNILSNTNIKTRRKYISRFLDSCGAYYICNIDYGDNHYYTDLKGNLRRATCREHYHAIIQTDFIDLKTYNLGWLNVEHVYVKTDSTKKLSKYITKLTNHALKESTKRQNLLYSKKYQIL